MPDYICTRPTDAPAARVSPKAWQSVRAPTTTSADFALNCFACSLYTSFGWFSNPFLSFESGASADPPG
jgi:hypothetical protein